MFGIAQKGPIVCFEAASLAANGSLTHGFCTRLGGISRAPFDSLNAGDRVGDREDDRRRNLARIGEAFAIPGGDPVLMRQLHGDRIRLIETGGPLPDGPPECDGLITDRPGVALGVRTADCVPILYADPIRGVIGAAHAGWRGTALGIAARMTACFRERFSSRPEDLLVAIGPAIGACCYEVDAPVIDAFAAVPGVELCSRPAAKAGRWMLDLALANRLQLEAAGIPPANVSVSGLCTQCRQDLFFSHRASNGHTGRQLSLILARERHSRCGK